MASTLIIATGHHFEETPEGVFTCGPYTHGFFERFLEVFDAVEVVARVRRRASVPGDYRRVDGPGVRVAALPEFNGAAALLQGLGAIGKQYAQLARRRDAAFLLRVPGLPQTLFWLFLLRYRRPYSLEVITDPDLDYRRRTYGSRGAFLLRPLMTRALRVQCRLAASTAYVTRHTLQALYPPGNERTYSYSSLDLDEEAFALGEQTLARLRVQPDRLPTVHISFTGGLGRPQKGLDVLLRAAAELQAHHRVELTIIGGGALLDTYRRVAEELGLGAQARFTGTICDPLRLYALLAQSDVFVLPTRREGLPRAIIEAMALGLPCIATPVAGVPELLEDPFLVPPEDPSALADKIRSVAESKRLRLEASQRNRDAARAYARERVQPVRRQHYLIIQQAARIGARTGPTTTA